MSNNPETRLKPIHPESFSKEFLLGSFSDADYLSVKSRVESGIGVQVSISKKDLNQGNIFATQAYVVPERVRRMLRGETSGRLPIKGVIRKRKSKKNPDKSVYEILILNGHHRISNAFRLNQTITVHISEVFDSDNEKSPNVYDPKDVRPFNLILRLFEDMSR